MDGEEILLKNLPENEDLLILKNKYMMYQESEKLDKFIKENFSNIISFDISFIHENEHVVNMIIPLFKKPSSLSLEKQIQKEVKKRIDKKIEVGEEINNDVIENIRKDVIEDMSNQNNDKKDS